MLVVECKAKSFGLESSNCEQTRTLLLSATTLKDYHTIFACVLVPENDRVAMTTTLRGLHQELSALKLQSVRAWGMGLDASAEGELALVFDSETVLQLGCPTRAVVLRVEPGTDPRPLYLVPYDPGVFSGQTPAEQTMCLRILREKLHVAAISSVGRAPLGAVDLLVDSLLAAVHQDIYDRWHDRDAKKHLRKIAVDLVDSLAASVNAERERSIQRNAGPGPRWRIEIPTDNARLQITELMMKFSVTKLRIPTDAEQVAFPWYENEEADEEWLDTGFPALPAVEPAAVPLDPGPTSLPAGETSSDPLDPRSPKSEAN